LEGKIVGLFLIALIGGLVGGFGLSYIIYQPQVQNLQNTTNNLQNQVTKLNSTLQGLLNMSGAGVNNQVQVSGTTQEEHPSEMYFSSLGLVNGSRIQTSSLITNGQYSVVLVGGQSYDVRIYYQPVGYTYPPSRPYSIYVPSGVTTFTANF
jgi:predicted PurR-regulated permease PerM